MLFTVHCKMDSSPIVTTHTNDKSKSSRKSLVRPTKEPKRKSSKISSSVHFVRSALSLSLLCLDQRTPCNTYSNSNTTRSYPSLTFRSHHDPLFNFFLCFSTVRYMYRVDEEARKEACDSISLSLSVSLSRCLHRVLRVLLHRSLFQQRPPIFPTIAVVSPSNTRFVR